MKMKNFVLEEKCITCRGELATVLSAEDFISREGKELDFIRVELHCGLPGHSMYFVTVHKNELANLPDYDFSEE